MLSFKTIDFLNQMASPYEAQAPSSLLFSAGFMARESDQQAATQENKRKQKDMLPKQENTSMNLSTWTVNTTQPKRKKMQIQVNKEKKWRFTVSTGVMNIRGSQYH